MYFLLPCKKTTPVDVGATLRSAILAALGDREAKTAECTEACRVLSNLRRNANQTTAVDPRDLASRQTYLRAVAFLSESPAIPSLLASPRRAALPWSDAFDAHLKTTCPSLHLDRTSLRWNVAAGMCEGALLAFRGAISHEQTQEALKGASKTFQVTAGLFNLLADGGAALHSGDGDVTPSPDLSRTGIVALQNAFLGNAQLASYLYSVGSAVTPPAIRAKVVAGARDCYVRALRNAVSPEMVDTAMAKTVGAHVAVLVEVCEAEAQYQTELGLGDAEEVMPERLGRARESVAALERAKGKLVKVRAEDGKGKIEEGLKEREVVIRARADEVKRQNSYIYHAAESTEVAAVAGRQLSVALPWEDGECGEKAILELPQVLASSATEAKAAAEEVEKRAAEEKEREAKEVAERERAAVVSAANRRARELEVQAAEQERLEKEAEARAREAAAREQEREARDREMRERHAAQAAQEAAAERQREARRVSEMQMKEQEEAAVRRRDEEEYRQLAHATVGTQKDGLRGAQEALLGDISIAERALDREESTSVTVSRVVVAPPVGSDGTERPAGVSEEDAYATVRTAVEAGGLKCIAGLQVQVKGLASSADKKLDEIRRVLVQEASEDIAVRRKAVKFGLPMPPESSVLNKRMYERLDRISASVGQAHKADQTIELSIEKHRAKLEPLAGLNLAGVQPGAAARAASREEQTRLVLSAKTQLYNALRADLGRARGMVQEEASLSRDFDVLLAADDPQVALGRRTGNTPIRGLVQLRYGDLCNRSTLFAKQVSSTRDQLRQGLSSVQSAAQKTQPPPPPDSMNLVWKHYMGARKHANLEKYLREGLGFYAGEDATISGLLDESRDFAMARASQAAVMDHSISSHLASPPAPSRGQAPSQTPRYVSNISDQFSSASLNEQQPPFPGGPDNRYAQNKHSMPSSAQQGERRSYQAELSSPGSGARSSQPPPPSGRVNIYDLAPQNQAHTRSMPGQPQGGHQMGAPQPQSGGQVGAQPGIPFPVPPQQRFPVDQTLQSNRTDQPSNFRHDQAHPPPPDGHPSAEPADPSARQERGQGLLGGLFGRRKSSKY